MQNATLWNNLAGAHNELLAGLSGALAEMTPTATWQQDGAAWTWRSDKLYIMPLTGTQAKLPSSESCAAFELRCRLHFPAVVATLCLELNMSWNVQLRRKVE